MIGQRLSHYRIVEKIGAGGMGVVYRAHDEQLDRDVAIKVLPARSLESEEAQKQFRKEAQSLARLNHPNVATVHEFGSQDGVDFLVTEYIAGINLDVKLTEGPLSPAEVMRLGMQLAEGLAAAHQQGIVHRDLKPGNLRLTTDGRLKILDFGLAQMLPHGSELGLTATRTQMQETSGTLPYMSPEQLKGEVADARTDIWAAGAVLHEMCTGKRTFVENTPALLINAILNQPPEPPSKQNPAVPPTLDEVILKALAHDPKDRYQSANQLAADLRTPTVSGAIPILPRGRRSKRLGLIAVATAALLALSAVGYSQWHHKRIATTPAATVNRRRSVAVLGFKNLSQNPEKSWLSTAISEMLTTELSQGDELRTIPGESVAQMKLSLSLPEADSFSRETLTRIRQNLGSDSVVLGSYLPLGNGQLRLDLRLQDAIAGETLVSVSEKGSESEIDSMVSKAGAELRAKLGVGALSDAESASVRASLPSNPEAARLYSQGLEKLRVFDALAARDSLEKAARLDPAHAPTHSALAEALSVLGYEGKAKEQAKKALELSPQFSREERLLIEGRAHEQLSEMPQAVESYRALWQFFPDNIDYGLFLMRAQIAGGHPTDAEKTLADIRKLDVSEADAARVDIAESLLAATQSDFKRQEATASRAASEGLSVGASLIVAQALQQQAHAWERMGDSKKTIDLANQARALFIAAGNRRNAARTDLQVGDTLFDQGDFEGARQKFENTLPVFREVGARTSTRAALERIGNTLYGEGKYRESLSYYNQALEIDHEINDPYGLASDYGNLANSLDGLGDLAGSLKMQQQSLAMFNQVGDRRGASETINNIAIIAVEMGNLSEATKYYNQSLSMSREILFLRGQPYPLMGLGDILFAQGDLEGSRKRYEEALALGKQMNDTEVAAQVAVSLGQIELAEHKYSDGVAQARQAVAAYEKNNSIGNQAWAQAILARNLLAAGSLAEAQAATARSISLAKQTTAPAPGYESVLADSRVKAKSGKTADALKELEAPLASAKKIGYKLYEYQIALAIGEIESGSGSASARPRLTALEKDARAQGALLFAGQAQALLNQDSKAQTTKKK